MKKTGLLTVNMGISRLDGTRLARASAGDPFGAATNFLANRGLDDSEVIWVTGTEGSIGTVPVIFISEAGPAILAAASLPPTRTAETLNSITERKGTKKTAKKSSRTHSAKKSGSKRGKEQRKPNERV